MFLFFIECGTDLCENRENVTRKVFTSDRKKLTQFVQESLLKSFGLCPFFLITH